MSVEGYEAAAFTVERVGQGTQLVPAFHIRPGGINGHEAAVESFKEMAEGSLSAGRNRVCRLRYICDRGAAYCLVCLVGDGQGPEAIVTVTVLAESDSAAVTKLNIVQEKIREGDAPHRQGAG